MDSIFQFKNLYLIIICKKKYSFFEKNFYVKFNFHLKSLKEDLFLIDENY